MELKRGGGVKFLMDTDWLFQGIIDSEQKQYVLLDYFKKMNKFFEEMKLYPMFIELSLHLGNIQTLITQNKILFTNKKFYSNDDELLLSDLLVRDIPVLATEEVDEYHKILKLSYNQFLEYFNFAKSLWSVVYESMDIIIRKNKKNLESKRGFFYFQTNDKLYIWGYTIKKVYKTENQTRTHLDLIFEGDKKDLTIDEIIATNSKTYEVKNEKTCPIFEVRCSEEFPLYETLLPIFKRKIISYINKENGVPQKKN